MTDSATAFMHYLKTEYQTASFPDLKCWAFSPDNQQQSEVFAELRGQQLIRKLAEGFWGLTERGLEWVLAQLPLSPAAQGLWDRLKAAYAKAGRPKRRTWTLSPGEPHEVPAFNELRARGYLDALTEDLFILSAHGMNRSGS